MRFASIDDGTMWSMLRSNAEGIGLHVGHLCDEDCCGGYYLGRACDKMLYKDRNNPWLFPSIVSWKSVIQPNNLVHPDYIKNYAIDYPSVAITHVNSPMSDLRWAFSNINYQIDQNGMYDDPNYDLAQVADDLIIGLVPLWTVMPIFSKERYIALQKSLSNLMENSNIDMFSNCYCMLENNDWHSSDCPNSDYNFRERIKCYCAEKMYEDYDDLLRNSIPVEHYLDNTTKQTWREAVNRYYDGWDVLSQFNHQGEQWASYWQQVQSPFLGSPGQNFRDLLGLTG